MTDAPPTDEPAAAPAPAQSTELAAAYAAGVGASGDNRYAHLMTSDQQKEFRDTFEFFDVDKGGDVDNRELGLMFRQLGLTPSDEEVERMIADFDYDHSGTIDFEEFCGMMLSSVRAARTPAWLTDRFAEGVATADLTRAGAQKLLPLDLQLAVVDTLRRPTVGELPHEARRRRRRRRRGRRRRRRQAARRARAEELLSGGDGVDGRQASGPRGAAAVAVVRRASPEPRAVAVVCVDADGQTGECGDAVADASLDLERGPPPRRDLV